MKVNNFFLLLLIFTILYPSDVPASTSSSLKSLTSQMHAWFKAPVKTDLASWRYSTFSNVHKLAAISPLNGGGELLYRLNSKVCVISIPHRFFDTYTYDIGKRLFASHCQLLVSNTHHRYSKSLDKQSMDYSKRHYNLHNASILAYQSLNKSAKVIQIHGFNQKKRKTSISRQADFIVSQGRKGNFVKQKLTTCFNKISKHSLFYPEMVRELGGTKNILHTLELVPHSFIHIEISKPMRKRLINEQHTMSQFSECINQII